VRDVVAYLALQGALLSYPPRERWVCDVVAYTAGDIVMRWIVRHPDPLNEGRNEEKNGNASAEEATASRTYLSRGAYERTDAPVGYNIKKPTSHEVGMRELTLRSLKCSCRLQHQGPSSDEVGMKRATQRSH